MAASQVILRRSLRTLGIVALGVLGVVILVLGLFMVRPVRNAVLAQAIAKAKTHLPGELVVANASWPSVGAIGFRGVLWTAKGDTLAAADTLTLELNLKSLFHKDLHAQRIVATGVYLDLPALRAAFPPGTQSTAPARKKEGRFPRPGVFPGIPSLAAETIVLRVHRARFTPQWTIVESEVEGSCDLSPDTGPRLVLTRLIASTLERKLEVKMTPFHLDGRAKTMNGDLTVRLDSLGTLTLSVASAAPDSLHLLATLEPDGEGSPLRVDLRGQLSWDKERLQSYAFRGDIQIPETEELAHWPPPVRKVAVLSPLPPVSLRTDGVVSLRPQFFLRAHVASKPSGWLDGLEVTGAYSDAGIQIDTLRASLPGLRIAASGRRTGSSMTANADALVSDARWVNIVMPRFVPPESLVANVHLSMDGPRAEPGVRVELAGGFRKKGLSVRDVTVSANFADGLGSSGTVSLSGVSRDVRVSTRASLVPKFPLDASLSPILIDDLMSGTALPTTREGNGRVRYDGSRRILRLDDVRILGDAGRVQIDGNLSNGSGDATLAWESSAPPAMLRRVMTFADSSWVALEERWRADGPFTVHARGRIQGKRVNGQVEFVLPGPSTLRGFLPARANVDSLGPIRGRVDGSLDSLWVANMDLSPTTWLESTPIHVQGSPSRIAVDSLRLGVEGCSISLAGSRESGRWNAHGDLQVVDTRLIRRFVPAMTARDSCTASVRALVHGQNISVQFQGTGRYHNVRLRKAEGDLSRTEGRWHAQLSASGLDMGTALKLDQVSAGLTTEADGKEAVRLDCNGPTLSLATRAILDRRDGIAAQVDTLGLTMSDKELHTAQPFSVEARSHGNGFTFEDVNLQGTMGSVEGHVELRPGASEVDLRLALDLEGLTPPSYRLATWWPERLDVSIVNEGREALAARATVAGFRLRGQSDWVLEMTARGDEHGLAGEAHLKGAAGEALAATYFSPGLWQLYPLRIEMKPHQVEAEATLKEFPIPWQELGVDATEIWPASASGHFVVNHDDVGPYARGDLDVVFTPSDEKERAVRLTSQGAWMASTGQIDRLSQGETTPLSEINESRLREMNAPGLVASFAVSRDTQPQLTGSLSVRFVERPEGGFAIDPQNGLDLVASAPRFDLATLHAFLPAGYNLGGHLRLDAKLSGSPRNPALSGTVDAPDIALEMNDGGRVKAMGKLNYSGTLLAPKVQGRIDIKNGVIPIPEEPRKLHAVSGKALLWQSRAEADSVLAEVAETKKAETDTTGKFHPVYDLQIVVPSGFWIRGRNLNVELEGDLRLRQEKTVPTVVGTLEARQGTLNFLGRSFSLERGKVQFYGEDEINPSLDIRLTSKVSSTTVYVTMNGTLQEPKVELTSSPSMSEADIMSLLVMGKTSDDLNGDQAQLVAQRAAAVAATYGAAELQKRMAGPLGVDMITVNPGGGPEGENSVVVGKYLNSRTLLKYEQALDSAAGFFVTLEYTLTQTITLQTIAGTWQSGAEISWSKDY